MRLFIFFLAALWSNGIIAQWQGDTGKYLIFNDSLQLNDSIAGNAFLSYPLDIVDNAQWEFTVFLGFNPSSSNYAKVYLKSERADLQGNGYFVKIGDTNDEISLFRQDGSILSNEKIIDGADDRVDLSAVQVRIKVNYEHGLWSLYSHLDNDDYQLEGTVRDSTYFLSSYFGVYSNYTKTRAKLISFSQFLWAGNAYEDTDPPRLDSALVLTKNSMQFYFNEHLDTATFTYQNTPASVINMEGNKVLVQFANNFPLRDTFNIQYRVRDSANNSLEDDAKAYYTPFEVLFAQLLSPDSLAFNLNKPASVISPSNIMLDNRVPNVVKAYNDGYLAVFESPLPERTLATLIITNIQDEHGDYNLDYRVEIAFITPRFQDLVFTEIMPDPNPVVDALPEEEYIEIFNASAYTIHLENWYLQREDHKYSLPNEDILPFSYAILCSGNAFPKFPSTLHKIKMPSFPSLLNTEMELTLKSPNGTMIDYLYYQKSWHKDDFHAEGGFSLERIDLQNPGMYGNWTSSCAPQGGTPGAANCTEAYNPDTIAPEFTLVYALDQKWIHLQLKEAIYKAYITDISYYNMSDKIAVSSVLPIGNQEFVDELLIGLDQAMDQYKVYELSISGISDLSGNVMDDALFQVALCATADSADILFTEVMFDPISGGVEYLELYNASNTPLDLSQYALARPDSLDTWSSAYALADHTLLFLPQTYLVLTGAKDAFLLQYPTINAVLEVHSFPSLNNTTGEWGLLNKSAQVIDRMSYDVAWHSVLLQNTKGVALERVCLEASARIPSNWQSASSLVNYATPGSENSRREDIQAITSVSQLSPNNFTPDGDGIDDVAKISIDGNYAGSKVKISIYNQRGILVKNLSESDLIGSFPVLYWDGTDNEMQRCAMGPYIIFIEIMTPDNEMVYDRQEVIVSAKIR